MVKRWNNVLLASLFCGLSIIVACLTGVFIKNSAYYDVGMTSRLYEFLVDATCINFNDKNSRVQADKNDIATAVIRNLKAPLSLSSSSFGGLFSISTTGFAVADVTVNGKRARVTLGEDRVFYPTEDALSVPSQYMRLGASLLAWDTGMSPLSLRESSVPFPSSSLVECSSFASYAKFVPFLPAAVRARTGINEATLTMCVSIISNTLKVTVPATGDTMEVRAWQSNAGLASGTTVIGSLFRVTRQEIRIDSVPVGIAGDQVGDAMWNLLQGQNTLRPLAWTEGLDFMNAANIAAAKNQAALLDATLPLTSSWALFDMASLSVVNELRVAAEQNKHWIIREAEKRKLLPAGPLMTYAAFWPEVTVEGPGAKWAYVPSGRFNSQRFVSAFDAASLYRYEGNSDDAYSVSEANKAIRLNAAQGMTFEFTHELEGVDIRTATGKAYGLLPVSLFCVTAAVWGLGASLLWKWIRYELMEQHMRVKRLSLIEVPETLQLRKYLKMYSWAMVSSFLCVVLLGFFASVISSAMVDTSTASGLDAAYFDDFPNHFSRWNSVFNGYFLLAVFLLLVAGATLSYLVWRWCMDICSVVVSEHPYLAHHILRPADSQCAVSSYVSESLHGSSEFEEEERAVQAVEELPLEEYSVHGEPEMTASERAYVEGLHGRNPLHPAAPSVSTGAEKVQEDALPCDHVVLAVEPVHQTKIHSPRRASFASEALHHEYQDQMENDEPADFQMRDSLVNTEVVRQLRNSQLSIDGITQPRNSARPYSSKPLSEYVVEPVEIAVDIAEHRISIWAFWSLFATEDEFLSAECAPAKVNRYLWKSNVWPQVASGVVLVVFFCFSLLILVSVKSGGEKASRTFEPMSSFIPLVNSFASFDYIDVGTGAPAIITEPLARTTPNYQVRFGNLFSVANDASQLSIVDVTLNGVTSRMHIGPNVFPLKDRGFLTVNPSFYAWLVNLPPAAVKPTSAFVPSSDGDEVCAPYQANAASVPFLPAVVAQRNVNPASLQLCVTVKTNTVSVRVPGLTDSMTIRAWRSPLFDSSAQTLLGWVSRQHELSFQLDALPVAARADAWREAVWERGAAESPLDSWNTAQAMPLINRLNKDIAANAIAATTGGSMISTWSLAPLASASTVATLREKAINSGKWVLNVAIDDGIIGDRMVGYASYWAQVNVGKVSNDWKFLPAARVDFARYHKVTNRPSSNMLSVFSHNDDTANSRRDLKYNVGDLLRYEFSGESTDKENTAFHHRRGVMILSWFFFVFHIGALVLDVPLLSLTRFAFGMDWESSVRPGCNPSGRNVKISDFHLWLVLSVVLLWIAECQLVRILWMTIVDSTTHFATTNGHQAASVPNYFRFSAGDGLTAVALIFAMIAIFIRNYFSPSIETQRRLLTLQQLSAPVQPLDDEAMKTEEASVPSSRFQVWWTSLMASLRSFFCYESPEPGTPTPAAVDEEPIDCEEQTHEQTFEQDIAEPEFEAAGKMDFQDPRGGIPQFEMHEIEVGGSQASGKEGNSEILLVESAAVLGELEYPELLLKPHEEEFAVDDHVDLEDTKRAVWCAL